MQLSHYRSGEFLALKRFVEGMGIYCMLKHMLKHMCFVLAYNVVCNLARCTWCPLSLPRSIARPSGVFVCVPRTTSRLASAVSIIKWTVCMWWVHLVCEPNFVYLRGTLFGAIGWLVGWRRSLLCIRSTRNNSVYSHSWRACFQNLLHPPLTRYSFAFLTSFCN